MNMVKTLVLWFAMAISFALVILILFTRNTSTVPTSIPWPTGTPIPIDTPAPTGPPSYSQVLSTYPDRIDLCGSSYLVEDVLTNGQWSQNGSVDIVNGVFLLQCFGVKVVLNVSVTLDSVTYPPSTMLTVDKDLNWIEVSSWD